MQMKPSSYIDAKVVGDDSAPRYEEGEGVIWSGGE
jgi:hypothetical protein